MSMMNKKNLNCAFLGAALALGLLMSVISSVAQAGVAQIKEHCDGPEDCSGSLVCREGACRAINDQPCAGPNDDSSCQSGHCRSDMTCGSNDHCSGARKTNDATCW